MDRTEGRQTFCVTDHVNVTPKLCLSFPYFTHLCRSTFISSDLTQIYLCLFLLEQSTLPEVKEILCQNQPNLQEVKNCNILDIQRIRLYIGNDSVPRCKHFPSQLYKPIS
jgi:hypothetical protein